MFGNASFEDMLLLQIKYGKRNGAAFSDWIMKKRTLSIAALIISEVSAVDFYDLETAIYFHCVPDHYKWFIKSYAIPMEEAAIHPEKFAETLDEYLKNCCITIEKNSWYREFYDFCAIILKERMVKQKQGYKNIVSAYISLLMQQSAYFTRAKIEYSIYGILESGEPLYQKCIHPYLDLGVYDLEKDLLKDNLLSPHRLCEAFKKYGYEIHSLQEWAVINNMNMTYENNTFRMVPYIDKRTAFVAINEPYIPHALHFPRMWKKTEVYQQRLKARNYLVPASGITASYVNAGDIREIRFIETIYDNEIVMLYRVSTYENGQFSGYYFTKSDIFYSIYEESIGPMHEQIKNFVLENYMLLTCDYEIRNKRNYAIRQTEDLAGEFHYPDQPLVLYKYRPSARTKTTGKKHYIEQVYHKEEYQEEIKTRVGYIRNLPAGQHASDTARQNAEQLGFRLAEGKTYVRSHTYRMYHNLKTNI